jgi:hypothetical protein
MKSMYITKMKRDQYDEIRIPQQDPSEFLHVTIHKKDLSWNPQILVHLIFHEYIRNHIHLKQLNEPQVCRLYLQNKLQFMGYLKDNSHLLSLYI